VANKLRHKTGVTGIPVFSAVGQRSRMELELGSPLLVQLGGWQHNMSTLGRYQIALLCGRGTLVWKPRVESTTAWSKVRHSVTPAL